MVRLADHGIPLRSTVRTCPASATVARTLARPARAAAHRTAPHRPAPPRTAPRLDHGRGRPDGPQGPVLSHRRAVPSAAVDEPDAVPETPTARTAAIVASLPGTHRARHLEDRPPPALVAVRRPEAR